VLLLLIVIWNNHVNLVFVCVVATWLFHFFFLICCFGLAEVLLV